MPKLLLTSMECCLFIREFQFTIKKRWYQDKKKKKNAAKQTPHIQTTDCKLLTSIKRNVFSYNCKTNFTSNYNRSSNYHYCSTAIFWTQSLPVGSGLVKKKSGVVSVLFQK